MRNEKTMSEPKRDLSAMRSDFHAAITRVVESTPPSQQASACTDVLRQQMHLLGIPVNIEYAQKALQRALEGGRLVERCMDWWDEVASGIRWPVAICYVVTGKLPGGYVRHTVAAMSVYDRDGKPVAHGAVEWAGFASTELTDKESYGGFNRAISEKAAELGARSMFEFAGECLRKSVSIAHDPEQGPMWFDDRRYGERKRDEGDENSLEDDGGQLPEKRAVAGSVSDDGDRCAGGDPGPSGLTGNDFLDELKRRAKGTLVQTKKEEANEHERF